MFVPNTLVPILSSFSQILLFHVFQILLFRGSLHIIAVIVLEHFDTEYNGNIILGTYQYGMADNTERILVKLGGNIVYHIIIDGVFSLDVVLRIVVKLLLRI